MCVFLLCILIRQVLPYNTLNEVCAQVKEWLDSIYDDLEIAYMKDGPIKHPDKRNVKYAQEQAMKGVSDVFDKMPVFSLQAR